MKRIVLSICSILVVSILFTSCTAPKGGAVKDEKAIANMNKTGYPIVNETYSLNVATVVVQGQPNFDEVEAVKKLEKKTNIKVNWTVATSDAWAEKKNLMFASGELPDIFIGNWVLEDNDLLKYGEQGLLLEVNDLIKEYAPDLQKDLDNYPEIVSMSTTEKGKMYATPVYDFGESTISSQSAFFINQKWLKTLRLPVPTTTNEYYETLKKFRDNDPNGNGKQDEYGFSGMGQEFLGAFGHFDYVNHLAMENGEIIFVPIQEGYKESIQFQRKLFEEKLIDPDAFTQTASVAGAKLKAQTRSIGSFFAWRENAFQRTPDDDEYIAVPPLKGPKGIQYAVERENGFRGRIGAAITNKCKAPEIAMRWINEFYNADNTGKIVGQYYYGYNAEVTADNKVRYLKPYNFETDKYITMPIGLYNEVKGKNLQPETLPEVTRQKRVHEKIYEPYYPKDAVKTSFLTMAETKRLSQIVPEINNYIKQKYAEWVTKGNIEEEWDAYVKKLKEIKVDEYVAIMKAAHDRLK